MRFTPKSEEEINSFTLMEEGVYQFRVAKAEDQVSKGGNEMIKLTLVVWDKDGGKHVLYDYLLEKVAYKLRHFADSAGLIEKYNIGMFNAEDCENKEGSVHITVQNGQPKEGGGYYPSKNAVKDYVVGASKVYTDLNKLKKENDLDDDIPF